MATIELSNEAVLTVVSNAVVAGTSTVTSTVLDSQGFDATCYLVSFGTITNGSVVQAVAYENTTSAVSGATTVASGSSASVTCGTASSNTTIILDVVRAQNRYQFCEVTRATQNAVINNIIAVQYRARNIPVTQPTACIAQALVAPEV